MNFYDNYVALCNRAGKTPSAVALEMGLSKPAVHRWKNGGGVTDATAAKVAEYFGVSVDYMWGTEEEKPTPEPTVSDPMNLQLFAEEKKEPTVKDDELYKKQLMLIDFARSVPAEKVDLVLRVMQSIVESDD